MRGENQEQRRLTGGTGRIYGLGEMMCDISRANKLMNLFHFLATFPQSGQAERLSLKAASKKKYFLFHL